MTPQADLTVGSLDSNRQEKLGWGCRSTRGANAREVIVLTTPPGVMKGKMR